MNRILGIDPGSRFAGLAVVEDDKLLFSQQVILNKKSNNSEGLSRALFLFMQLINATYEQWQPSLIVVEHTSYPRNMNTTKLLTYYEAMALLVAGQKECLIERVRTTAARKKVLGKGNFDKSDIQTWAYEKFGLAFGQDEAEAIVFALYGGIILVDG